MKMHFNELKLERIVLELRFDEEYLYWDNCGKIWKSIIKKWPDLERIKIDPQNAAFQIKDQSLELNFGPNFIRIIQGYPESSLKTFKEFSVSAFPIITEYLEIRVFTRIGNRYTYIYPTRDKKESSELVNESSLINIPEKKIKLFGVEVNEPGVNFRIEDDDFGYRFVIQSQSRQQTIEVPKPFKIDTSEYPREVVLIDIDCYTLKPTNVSMTDYKEIVRRFKKQIEQNLETLIS